MNTTSRESVKIAFELQPLLVKTGDLRFPTALPAAITASRKFMQILASIAAVGLIEPIVVQRDRDDTGTYVVLDGRLRVEALKRLNVDEVTCLISTDDEAYTYNKHLNRLTPAQDARMIARAIERGVPRSRLASVLGVETQTVKRRANLLTGICPEAATMLADKHCPAATFRALRSLTPLRQFEAAELMCGQDNFSSAFAKAIVAATPENQIRTRVMKRQDSEHDLATQLVRLERELATLQTNASDLEEQYGIDQLHLAVSGAYVASLMENEAVSGWLSNKCPEYFELFRQIAAEANSTKESRRTPRLPYQMNSGTQNTPA